MVAHGVSRGKRVRSGAPVGAKEFYPEIYFGNRYSPSHSKLNWIFF
jgi:hypothetical protein